MKPLRKPVLLAAILFTLLTAVLFFLPGKNLPAAGWMAELQVDKWVHVGIFFLLCVLWSVALNIQTSAKFLGLASVAFIYGCLVEWVQHNFITNRSFDVYDVVADAVGIVVAFTWWRYIKK